MNAGEKTSPASWRRAHGNTAETENPAKQRALQIPAQSRKMLRHAPIGVGPAKPFHPDVTHPFRRRRAQGNHRPAPWEYSQCSSGRMPPLNRRPAPRQNQFCQTKPNRPADRPQAIAAKRFNPRRQAALPLHQSCQLRGIETATEKNTSAPVIRTGALRWDRAWPPYARDNNQRRSPPPRKTPMPEGWRWD